MQSIRCIPICNLAKPACYIFCINGRKQEGSLDHIVVSRNTIRKWKEDWKEDSNEIGV